MRRLTNWLTRARRPKCGKVRTHPGAHRAPLAEEELEEPRFHDAGFGFLDGLRELGRAFAHHDVARDEVFLNACHLQHPAADREQPAASRVGRVEVARRHGVEVDAACRQHPAQLGEGERLVDLAVEIRGNRFALLGDARPDEDDADRVAVDRPEETRHGNHRRDNRRKRPGQVGMIAAHVADHRGARGGNPQLVGVLGRQPPVLIGHQFGAERNLVGGGESHRLQRAHHLRVLVADELGGEARRDNRRHRHRAGEERLDGLDGRQDPLGALRADLEAVRRSRCTAPAAPAPSGRRCGSPSPGTRARTGSRRGSARRWSTRAVPGKVASRGPRYITVSRRS